jgi:flagellar biosynthetic protein FlhB
MAETTGQEKTEAPTPQRLRKAREEGNVARSTDLTAALMLLFSIVVLYLLSSRLFESMAAVLHRLLSASDASNPTRADDIGPLMNYLLGLMSWTVLPMLIAIAAVGVLVTASQTGLMLTGKPLIPKFSKLNPWAGVKRLVDARAAIRLVMSLGKVIIISAVATLMIMAEIDAIAALPMMTLGAATKASAHMTFMLALKLAGLLVILALLDFSFQKYQHIKDMRMSKQDVKEEMKQMEGDPLMKQRRAAVARQLAMQRMAQQVPNADVVITNPTHLSIALRYDSENMRAPKVIAKGADFMAMRIRQIATANGVPLVERKPLARALYSSVEVGDEVPEEHYAAVAEILAYVYRLSGKVAS